MRPDRGAGRQQFLSHDIAFEHAALAAAIALRPGHPDPATRAEPPAERRRPMAAEIAVRHPEAGGELPGNELAHLGPQKPHTRVAARRDRNGRRCSSPRDDTTAEYYLTTRAFPTLDGVLKPATRGIEEGGRMQQRRLGGLEVSAVGLGCATMTPFYDAPDTTAVIETLQRAREIGVDFLDTSDAYGQGKNEELIARAVEGHRDEYVIASKFGNLRSPDGSP